MVLGCFQSHEKLDAAMERGMRSHLRESKQWPIVLFVVLLHLLNHQVFANEARIYRDSQIGVSTEVPRNWNVKQRANGFALIHKSELANCVFGLQAIPGIEFLTREELDEKTDRYYNAYNLEKVLNEGERKKNDIFTNTIFHRRTRYVVTHRTEVDIDGVKAVNYLTTIEREAEVKAEVEVETQSSADSLRKLFERSLVKKKYEFLPDKRARSLTFLTNEGNYNVTCTSAYGDFEVSDRAFKVIIGSIHLED